MLIRFLNSIEMYVRTIVAVYITICVWRALSELREFATCQHELRFKLKDGKVPHFTFSWLGFIQYVNEYTGHAHPTNAPRVILIHKQLILTAAQSLAQIPHNYKLGNVFFAEYRREEQECGLTMEDILLKNKCDRAYLEVPIVKFDTHPEYSSFGIQDSVAVAKLLTPMKSMYMVPICLPSMKNRYELKNKGKVMLIDYMSAAPRNLQNVQMAKRTLKLFTQRTCKRRRRMSELGPEGITHVLCTSGCGVRTNSPIVSYTDEGSFEIIGIAVGGGPCINSTTRSLFNDDPPFYIDVFPYNSWITSVVTAHVIPNIFAHTLRLRNGMAYGAYEIGRKTQKSGWSGSVFMAGNSCFSTKKSKSKGAFIYEETFLITTNGGGKDGIPFRIEIKIDCGVECKMICVRLSLPTKTLKPKISGVGTSGITVDIGGLRVIDEYELVILISGKNATRRIG